MVAVDVQCMHEWHMDLLPLTWSSVLLVLMNALTFNTTLPITGVCYKNAFAVMFWPYIVCSIFGSYAHFTTLLKAAYILTGNSNIALNYIHIKTCSKQVRNATELLNGCQCNPFFTTTSLSGDSNISSNQVDCTLGRYSTKGVCSW